MDRAAGGGALIASGDASLMRARRGPRLLLGLGALLLALGLAIAVIYFNRRVVAGHLLVDWLARRGVAADVDILRLDRDGVTARLRLGPRDNPEVAIEQAAVDYAISPPWSAGGFGVKLGEIRLQQPVVRASWRGGRLSLGSIDPLVRQALQARASTEPSDISVQIDAAAVRLVTDQGEVQLAGDARVEAGRLMHLAARMPSTSLQVGAVAVRDLEGSVQLNTTAERMALRVVVSAQGLSHPAARGDAIRADVRAEFPYPDMPAGTLAGSFSLQAEMAAGLLEVVGSQAQAMQWHAALEGHAAGDLATFNASAAGKVEVSARDASGQGGVAQDLQATFPSTQLTLARRRDGLDWTVRSASTLAAAGFQFGELTLKRLGALLDFDVRAAAAGGIEAKAEGSVQATQGSWPLLGAPLADDPPQLLELKRALRDFAVSLPGLQLASGAAGTRITLAQPARLTPANGGVLVLAPDPLPLYAASATQGGHGALRLAATRGGGLPEASVTVPDWHFTDEGFAIALQARALFDFDVAQGIAVGTRGVLSGSGGQLAYNTPECVDLHIAGVRMEDNAATGISGTVCPDAAPLFATTSQGWTWRSTFRGLTAAIPAQAVRVADLQGRFSATGSPRGTALEAHIVGGKTLDTSEPARFNPLQIAGALTLRDEHWNGALDLAAGAQRIGRVTLAHDARTATGRLRIDVPELRFDENGLQPAALSALAGEFVQSPATGAIRFTGQVDWAGAAPATSGGQLSIPRLDFASPAGAVKGLQGQIDFTSLTPLATAADQSLRVERVIAATEVTGLNLLFTVDDGSLRVSEGELHAAGGRLFAMPFAMPLDLTQPFSGTLVIETLQLGTVLADAGLADKLILDATVSGRLPFAWTPGQGVRIVGGTLAAIQPGRLTLKREMLAQVQTSAADQAPPGLVEDLAYQAMENLSFDTLSVDVNSLDKGRVGLVFRVKGRHDPPQHQELRVGLFELISRKFMQRRLPLPSDTRIDLTLDTTLNLNQLVADLLEVQRARQGHGTAPPAEAPVP